MNIYEACFLSFVAGLLAAHISIPWHRADTLTTLERYRRLKR